VCVCVFVCVCVCVRARMRVYISWQRVWRYYDAHGSLLRGLDPKRAKSQGKRPTIEAKETYYRGKRDLL